MLHLMAALTMTLQLADAKVTLTGLRQPGISEANPLMRGLVQHPAAVYAFKAGVGTSIILVTHEIAKHHPKRAFWFAVGVNVAQGFVVWHNVRTIHR